MNRKSISSNVALEQERLRVHYSPRYVRLLFVGESPPASGRFFYQEDSGLYRAIRNAFVLALPNIGEDNFLESFRSLGCYLVDLCGHPVDRLNTQDRREACRNAEDGLGKTLGRLRPKIVIAVVRSISDNVRRARQRAGLRCEHLELPYPGRWLHHRNEFSTLLKPVLIREFDSSLRFHGRGHPGKLLPAGTGLKYSEVQQDH